MDVRFTSIPLTMRRLSKALTQFLVALWLVQLATATESTSNGEFPSLSVQIDLGHFDGSETWYGLFRGDIADRTSLHYWRQSSERELALPLDGQRDDLTLVVLKKGSVPNIFGLTSELIDQGVSVDFSAGGSVQFLGFSSFDS